MPQSQSKAIIRAVTLSLVPSCIALRTRASAAASATAPAGDAGKAGNGGRGGSGWDSHAARYAYGSNCAMLSGWLGGQNGMRTAGTAGIAGRELTGQVGLG